MAAENPTWGEERIANELNLKLKIRISPRTVGKYLRRQRPVASPTSITAEPGGTDDPALTLSMRSPRTRTHPGDMIRSLFPSYSRADFSTTVLALSGWAKSTVAADRRKIVALRFQGI
jgi:hypothetical protein